jgi:hypothetical protein
LENIKLENCRFQPDVVNAMLRRAPVKIEAENYGRDGLNESYFVKHPQQLAKLYRQSEPVPIEPSGATAGRSRSGQSIQLTTGEWTVYTVASSDAATYDISVQAHSELAEPATLEVSVNDAPQEVDLANSAWTAYPLKPVALRAGPNKIKLHVKSGAAGIDWINVQLPGADSN